MSNFLVNLMFAAATMPTWMGVACTVSPMLVLVALIGWGLLHRGSGNSEPAEPLTEAHPWLVDRGKPVAAQEAAVPARRRHRYPFATWEPQPGWAPGGVLDQASTMVLPRVQDPDATVLIRGAR